MPSPFPGMNPFLEQADVWRDFHSSLLYEIRETLVKQVSPAYLAKLDEQLYIHEPAAESRRLLGHADLGVTPSSSKRNRGRQPSILQAPTEVTLAEVEVERLVRIEIRDRERRQLITVIELLSPTNKYAGDDRDQYEAKRGEILASRVHFVEIDLLRGGPRMPMVNMPTCDYCVLVSRVERRPRAELWPVALPEPLPVIPVPLREGDADAQINLQKLLHRVYDKAGYHQYIYARQPEPLLKRDQAAWAEQFLPGRAGQKKKRRA